MKYISKIPKADINLSDKMINNGWKILKEPKNLITATLISLPISIINIYLCIFFMKWINKDLLTITNSIVYDGKIAFTIEYIYIVYIYLYTLLHEVIHLILIPNFTKSKSTFISVRLWGGFVYTEEVIKKRRYLIITILPFIMLSFVVPLLMTLVGINPMIILTLSIINSAGASVDVLSFILLLFQVPKNSSIKNNGMKTFYISN
ncbi:DUF3267 domain-containing protein [Romboutsia sedimentorum]|uniref:DUF3267 domain-containing protein n=1 Tax=Romboutsia sedimentorum TaxID=1368474 RepID=A0ABT7EB87_9FIRM|nr:DUF3267 domain-containing protein [Romboutsia sedimentorum]MDK2564195.1 DUF3267 domain-containing protein [Romboutsia sedimentorum]